MALHLIDSLRLVDVSLIVAYYLSCSYVNGHEVIEVGIEEEGYRYVELDLSLIHISLPQKATRSPAAMCWMAASSAVYPAELQLDVRLQNDEAECRNEMHVNRIIYSNDIVPAKATGIQTRF